MNIVKTDFVIRHSIRFVSCFFLLFRLRFSMLCLPFSFSFFFFFCTRTHIHAHIETDTHPNKPIFRAGHDNLFTTVMQLSSYASPSSPHGRSTAQCAPVQFSLLYQLRHTAYSITARNSTSPVRLPGWSASSTPYALASTGDDNDVVATKCGTPPRGRSAHVSVPRPSQLHSHRFPSTSQSSPPRAWSPNLSEVPANTTSLASASPPLLSTMDKRELSKVVVRDAVYARVLDLVPGRQHVQIAVWTLSPHIIQIDGAVAVGGVPHPSSTAWCTAASASNPGRLSVSALLDSRSVLQDRLRELAVDSNLFASLLKPYLGEVGCQGDVVAATVDGAQLY